MRGSLAVSRGAGWPPLISYFKMALNPGRVVLFFALRTIVAGLLCLYLAFIFDLEQPKWALMTVIIISLPLAGMTLKRSFAQVVGTAAGAAMAVVIMALFPQAPMPFIVCLALWLAFCTAGGTLLRYTDSHAFVSAGLPLWWSRWPCRNRTASSCWPSPG